jgi:hypothetical protein
MEVCSANTVGMAQDINPYAWVHVSDDIRSLSRVAITLC